MATYSYTSSKKVLYKEVRKIKKGGGWELIYKPVYPDPIVEQRCMETQTEEVVAPKKTTKKAKKERKPFTREDWEVAKDTEHWTVHEQTYLPSYVKDKNGKNCPVHKTFGEAQAKYFELLADGLQAGGICQTSRGFQVRRGENPIKSKELNYKGGLCSYLWKAPLKVEVKLAKMQKQADDLQDGGAEKDIDISEEDIKVEDHVVEEEDEEDEDTDGEVALEYEEVKDAFGKTYYWVEEGENAGLYDAVEQNLIDFDKYSFEKGDYGVKTVIWL